MVLFKCFWRHTLEQNHKLLYVIASGCHDARSSLFSSPIIITHISCGSLLQIFIVSTSYVIHRTRHSYSESDREAGHSKKTGERGARNENGTDRMIQKGAIKIVNEFARWAKFRDTQSSTLLLNYGSVDQNSQGSLISMIKQK